MIAFLYDYPTASSLIGLIILILDIWAIFTVVVSSSPLANKILWILLILLLPVIGLILYLLFGGGFAKPKAL